MGTRPTPYWWAIGGLIGFSLATGAAEQSISLEPSKFPLAARQEISYPSFAPPTAVKQVQTHQAAVTIFNGSPQALEVTLTNGVGEKVLLKFPPCPTCQTYLPGQEPQDCFARSVSESYSIVPGEYEAKAVWSGYSTGFRSHWVMSSGWEHQQCVFLTYDPRTPY